MNGEGLRKDVVHLRGSRTWTTPVLLSIAVLLVAALAFNLANLDTGGESIPVGPGGGGRVPGSSVVEIDGTIVDVLIVVLSGFFLAGILCVLVFLRGRLPHRRRTRFSWEVLVALLGPLILLILLLAWPRAARGDRPENATGGGPENGGPLPDTASWPAADSPVAVLLIVAVLAAISVSMFFLRRSADPFRAARRSVSRVPEDRIVATEAVQAAIADLEIGADVRTAILACFQRFCSLLGNRGISDQLAMTPRELEALALERLRVPRQSSSLLTTLFEEARYSRHRLGERDRMRAIESLDGIRAALEA